MFPPLAGVPRGGTSYYADGTMLRGNSLRLVLLACLFILAFYLVLVKALEKEDMEVYLCDTTDIMRECFGLNDIETCADIGVPCVQSACCHQLAVGIDISVSGANDPLDEEGTATNVIAGLMIFWGLVPYALMFVLVAAFLFAGDTTSLSFACLLPLIYVMDEGVFKRIFSGHRPDGSCLYFKSYGMPSGHAATSIGVLWDMLLEIWVDRPALPLKMKFLLSATAIFFLAPVPFSRVYLHDHTLPQVGVGAAIGVFAATLWFLFMYKFARTRIDGWIDNSCSRWCILRNTYRTKESWLPETEQRSVGRPPEPDEATHLASEETAEYSAV